MTRSGFVPAIGLLLLFLAISTAFGSPGIEIIRDNAGGVRYATPAPGSEMFSGPAGENGSQAPLRTSYLWLDTNHQAAIAEKVAITGDGSYGVAGWWLNNMRTSLYQINGDNVPEWVRPMPSVQFTISVDADETGQRLTSTGRQDSLYVFDAASPNPSYSHWFAPGLVGYHSAVSDLGNTYAAGSGDPSGVAGALSVYDGSGAFRFKAWLPAPPEGVSVSGDGQVVAANVRSFALIFDAFTGARRDSIPISGETQQPALLSGDGSVLVTGGFSHVVRVYQWNGTIYAPLWSYTIPGTTWISALAISDDGSTVAAGTWTNGATYSGKVVIFDRSSATPLWTDSAYGDWVSCLALTANGNLLAAGSWGRYAGTVYNIISVYNRASGVPIESIGDDAYFGVGSCMGIDISEDGHYILAGGKAVHARDFGNGGWVMAIELADPAAAPDAIAGSVRTLTATPNPSAGAVRFDLQSSNATAGILQILSADGRRIRMLPLGAGSCVWDGLDEHGHAAPAGAYFIRALDGITAGSPEGTARIIRVR